MPSSDTVKRFREFSNGLVRKDIVRLLADARLPDASSVNAVAGATTRQGKKQLANSLALDIEVAKPEPSSIQIRQRYINDDGSSGVNALPPEPSVPARNPLKEVYEPLAYQAKWSIPVGRSVVQKAITFEARLDTITAWALLADVMSDKPIRSWKLDDPQPDFDIWEKALGERLAGVAGEVKNRKLYFLDVYSVNPDAKDIEYFGASISPFARTWSRANQFTDWQNDSEEAEYTQQLEDELAEYESRYEYLTNLSDKRLKLMTPGVNIPSRGETLPKRKDYKVPDCNCELYSGLHAETYGTHGQANSDYVVRLLSDEHFLHSFNAYLFVSQMYLRIKDRDSVVKDFTERPPKYPQVPESLGLGLVPENIFDNYPTKVFTYTKPDGRRCAAAFAGGLSAEELKRLHALLLAVDLVDSYELW